MNSKAEKLEAFARLLDVLDTLRAQCPWDREQTKESIRANTIEEVYELSEAILQEDYQDMKKELGDVLLHICFYALMAQEENRFDIADVCNTLCNKLIFRHPHVYGESVVNTASAVTSQWEQIKQHERGGNKTVLSGVPSSLPSLVKAYRVQDKARAVGFDWEEAQEVWTKVQEEIQEVRQALETKDAEDVEGEALGILILNRLKGALNTVAVKAPSFGDRRKEVLQDIATLTGASVITSDQGMTFDNVGLEVVGSARKVIVAKDNTTIIEGAGDKTTISQRIDQIKAQAGVATSDYDREQLDKRAAALSGKVAVIKVGGATETEIDEKKYRVDDAVAAVKAALLEGIVPGGGVTPINLASKITGDSAGAEIMRNALLMPFKQLATNAGLNAEALLAQVQEAKPGYGVDVANYQGKLIDLKKVGVVDPAMVTYQAIQNAVSIASTAMTMGALVVDIPEKPAAEAAGNPGMGMGY